MYDKYGKAADPWMTLVRYFNSINELGGTRRLVEDDVRSRLQRMDQRGLAKRNTPFMEELTSRKSSTDIPDVLDRLEQVFDPNQQKQDGLLRRIDVLLATNMISVGVDVKRLGLMVVTGNLKPRLNTSRPPVEWDEMLLAGLRRIQLGAPARPLALRTI